MHPRPDRSHRPRTRSWLRALLAGGLAVHSVHALVALLAGGWLASRVHAHHRGALGLTLGIAPLALGTAALAWPRLRRRVLVGFWWAVRD